MAPAKNTGKPDGFREGLKHKTASLQKKMKEDSLQPEPVKPGLWAIPQTMEIMAKTSCFSAGKHEKDYLFPIATVAWFFTG